LNLARPAERRRRPAARRMRFARRFGGLPPPIPCLAAALPHARPARIPPKTDLFVRRRSRGPVCPDPAARFAAYLPAAKIYRSLGSKTDPILHIQFSVCGESTPKSAKINGGLYGRTLETPPWDHSKT
jgi:hypothetical protein